MKGDPPADWVSHSAVRTRYMVPGTWRPLEMKIPCLPSNSSRTCDEDGRFFEAKAFQREADPQLGRGQRLRVECRATRRRWQHGKQTGWQTGGLLIPGGCGLRRWRTVPGTTGAIRGLRGQRIRRRTQNPGFLPEARQPVIVAVGGHLIPIIRSTSITKRKKNLLGSRGRRLFGFQ